LRPRCAQARSFLLNANGRSSIAARPHGFEQFVARQPALRLGELELAGEPRRRGISQRGASGEVGTGEGNEALNAIEMAICARLGLRANDYARRKAARPEIGDTIA
jgi:hypothetical protein